MTAKPTKKLRRILIGAIVIIAGTGLGLLIAFEVENRLFERRLEAVGEINATTGSPLQPGMEPGPENYSPMVALSPQPEVVEFDIAPADGDDLDVRDDELVVGVVIDGEARAYPINMLTMPQREIINDELAGREIAVTWCHLCHYGIVFDRRAGEQILTFRVSGKLWGGNLIMFDSQTGSEWSQVLGEAMQGSLRGTVLEVVPSQIMDWTSWRAIHPQTTVFVMPRLVSHYEKDIHIKYRDDLVFGLSLNGASRDWSMSELSESRVVNDRIGDTSVVVVFVESAQVANIYSREVNGDVLEFEMASDQLRDRKTGTQWDALTGKAIRGELSEASLRRLPGVLAFSTAWRLFHPGGTSWSPTDEGEPNHE